jgi:hypothetical protein
MEIEARKAVLPMLILLLIPFLSPTIFAESFYVSPSGSDADSVNGSINTPWKTLQHAVDAMQGRSQGNTLYLRAGTYGKVVVRDVPGLTIMAYPGELAIVSSPAHGDPNAYQPNTFDVRDSPSTGLKIKNLEISGGFYTLKLDGINAKNAVVEGCKIHGSGSDIVKIAGDYDPNYNFADGLLIQGNEIYDSGMFTPNNAQGIDSIGGVGITIRGNYIHDTASEGAFNKMNAVNAIIENNYVVNTGKVAGSAGLAFGMGGSDCYVYNRTNNPGAYECRNCIMRNNIVVNSKGGGVGLIGTYGSKVYNNTFYNVATSGQAGAWIYGTDNYFGGDCGDGYMRAENTNVDIRNNIFVIGSSRPMLQYGDMEGTITINNNIYYRLSGTPPYFSADNDEPPGLTFAQWKARFPGVDTSSITANPLLDSNYKPGALSPGTDKGVALAGFNLDYDKKTRPQGTGWDIGAFELGGGTVPPDPDPTVQDIIVDNSDSGNILTEGNWRVSTGIPGYYGSDYLYGIITDGSISASFLPQITQAGKYQMYLWWSTNPERETNVPVEVTTSQGVVTAYINQRANGNSWQYIGMYNLNQNAKIKIKVQGTTGDVIADALKLVYSNETCSDECSPAVKTCSSLNAYKTCGNYDADSCLEWSAITNCPANNTCSNGICSAPVCNPTPEICDGIDNDCDNLADETFTCVKNSAHCTNTCTWVTRQVNCSGQIPTNFESNFGLTAGKFTQTDINGLWTPQSKSYQFNITPGECSIKCVSGYEYYNNTCQPNTVQASCLSPTLPVNAIWNDFGQNGKYNQTCSSGVCTPQGLVAEYSAQAGNCKWTCGQNYHFEANSCVANTKNSACSFVSGNSLPINAVWNDNNRNGYFVQTWSANNYLPLLKNASYSEISGECNYSCKLLSKGCALDETKFCGQGSQACVEGYWGNCLASEGQVCTINQFCENDVCKTCQAGLKNCDQNLLNSCETNVLSDTNNCGSCGSVCQGACTNGICSGVTIVDLCINITCGQNSSCNANNGNCACNLGFSDCDGNTINGCEVNGLCNIDPIPDTNNPAQDNNKCNTGYYHNNGICTKKECDTDKDCSAKKECDNFACVDKQLTASCKNPCNEKCHDTSGVCCKNHWNEGLASCEFDIVSYAGDSIDASSSEVLHLVSDAVASLERGEVNMAKAQATVAKMISKASEVSTIQAENIIANARAALDENDFAQVEILSQDLEKATVQKPSPFPAILAISLIIIILVVGFYFIAKGNKKEEYY